MNTRVLRLNSQYIQQQKDEAKIFQGVVINLKKSLVKSMTSLGKLFAFGKHFLLYPVIFCNTRDMQELLLFISDTFHTLSSPENIIQIGGIALLLIIIYVETGFFIGLVLPGGDYLVFTAGLLCGSEYLDLSLAGLMGAMAGAAILGDFTGFTKGRWLGPKLFKKEESRFFKPSYLEKTRRFYEKYGAVAFILGRFMPVIRPLIPMLAGSSGYRFPKYVFMNISGAIVWIGLLTPIGYFIGQKYPNIMDYTLFILLGFVLMASIPALSILLKGKK